MAMNCIVKNWTAKRAGGRITVYGEYTDGTPRKVVGVDSIRAAKPWPVATDKNGVEYELQT